MKVGYQVLADLQQQQAFKQWGYKTSLTDEETLYPLPFTVLLGISAQLYRHPATSNTVHSILVNVTETSFKYYAGQYNLSCRPVPDADGWWFAFGISQLQWGFISNNKAVFPIAFTAFCSAATLFIRGSGTGTWYGDNANVTLTGLSCITPDYVLNGNFIVIGV